MSLQEKIANYCQTLQIEDSFSSLGNEIIEDLRALGSNAKADNSEHQQEMNIGYIWQAFQMLPNQFFDSYSQELFETILDIATQKIYNVYKNTSFSFNGVITMDVEPKSRDELVLFMLNKYITKVSLKEVLLYTKIFLEKKRKNLQLKLLIIKIFNYLLANIDKKEIFLSELLFSLFNVIYYSMKKYTTYKTRIDNQEYVETPEHVSLYVENYEAWIKDIFNSLLGSISTFANWNQPANNRNLFLLVEDLYNSSTGEYLKDKIQDREKRIKHYLVLFILDVLGVFFEDGNLVLSAETRNDLIEGLAASLIDIYPYLMTYIQNYIAQIKIKENNKGIQLIGKEDTETKQKEGYHVLTGYHPLSMAYLTVKFCNSQEAIPLASEYKLKFLFPSLHQVFLCGKRCDEIKGELISVINNLLEVQVKYQQHSPSLVENLNQYNIRLDIILERVLDYAGGPVDQNYRTLGLDFFSKIKRTFSEKAKASLFVRIIRDTQNSALAGYLMSEFKEGIMSALRANVAGDSIKDATSPFLNLNYLRNFFESGLNQGSSNFKDDYDIIGACINILLLVYLKYSNLAKNIENYKAIEFKDSSNLLRPANLGVILSYGEKALELSTKINKDMKSLNDKIEEIKKENPNEPNLGSYYMKYNELILMLDSLQRIEEAYQTLKAL